MSKTVYFKNIHVALETLNDEVLFEDAFITNMPFRLFLESFVNPEILAFFTEIIEIKEEINFKAPTLSILTETNFYHYGEDTYYRDMTGVIIPREELKEILKKEKAYFVS